MGGVRGEGRGERGGKVRGEGREGRGGEGRGERGGEEDSFKYRKYLFQNHV